MKWLQYVSVLNAICNSKRTYMPHDSCWQWGSNMVYATDKWDHPGLFPMFCLEPLAKLSEMAMERERERERETERGQGEWNRTFIKTCAITHTYINVSYYIYIYIYIQIICVCDSSRFIRHDSKFPKGFLSPHDLAPLRHILFMFLSPPVAATLLGILVAFIRPLQNQFVNLNVPWRDCVPGLPLSSLVFGRGWNNLEGCTKLPRSAVFNVRTRKGGNEISEDMKNRSRWHEILAFVFLSLSLFFPWFLTIIGHLDW